MHIGTRHDWLAAIPVARISLAFALWFVIGAAPALAQSSDPSDAQPAGEIAVAAQQENAASNALPHVTCVATSAERTFCPGDASRGVVLIKSNGPGECLLGRTWGYDQTGVWVRDGCSGEFVFGGLAQQQVTVDATSATSTPTRADAAHRDVGRIRSRRWLSRGSHQARRAGHQCLRRGAVHGPDARFADVCRSPRQRAGTTDGRNDVFPHRIIVYLKGWLANPKLG